jgi:hypothetical protein
MRLNDASGVPASSRQDFRTRCAPERARPYPYGQDAPGKMQARACPRPYPSWHERTLRLATRITTGVRALPAASMRAFRKLQIRVGINSFAELRSGQGGRSGGGKLVPALPNRAPF